MGCEHVATPTDRALPDSRDLDVPLISREEVDRHTENRLHILGKQILLEHFEVVIVHLLFLRNSTSQGSAFRSLGSILDSQY